MTERDLQPSAMLCQIARNTSTHVERTRFLTSAPKIAEKHLHARGEDPLRFLALVWLVETPPRTWRGRRSSQRKVSTFGNTSTHVERTEGERAAGRVSRKHLHARGEDASVQMQACSHSETPPRTWRGPYRKIKAKAGIGNTSTHVERTSMPAIQCKGLQKHLHARGED